MVRVAHADLARAMSALARRLAPPPPELLVGDLDGDVAIAFGYRRVVE